MSTISKESTKKDSPFAMAFRGRFFSLLSLAAVGAAILVPGSTSATDDTVDTKKTPPLQGQRAAYVLEALNLEERYAASVGLTSDELLDLLRSEDGMFLAGNGLLGYMEHAAPAATTAASLLPAPPLPSNFSAADAFNLNSQPQASTTIFLDFDGAEVRDELWNRTFGLETISAAPYDTDDDPSSFSATELADIVSVWQQVAADFSAFNVNVTTADPGPDALVRSDNSDSTYGTRLIITPTNWLAEQGGESWAGVAFLGIFRVRQ